VDLFGLFASTGLKQRLRERDNFIFLTSQDRTISLGDEYSFIVLADTHIINGSAHGLEKLQGVITADSNIKFVVVTGDITQCGNIEDIERFTRIADSLGVPCYPVIGNHDIYFDNWINWKILIGSTCYRIDGGTATLFILDSANAYFGKDQLDWLEKGLNSANGRIFIFSHANLFVKSPVDIQQFTDARERARICSILRDRADVMFTGHLHKRIMKELGGVKYLSIEDYKSTRTYCLVSVDKDGISFRYKNL
jgi:predicted phosphodiesterase